MHKLGMVHRDLKLENILINDTDGSNVVKIIDFGIARKHYGSFGEPMSTVVGRHSLLHKTMINHVTFGRSASLHTYCCLVIRHSTVTTTTRCIMPSDKASIVFHLQAGQARAENHVTLSVAFSKRTHESA